ncbi:MAG: hypothetical protein EPN23_02720 [Verrucomicrobia bacterium]|nr:MAG: hypothetical protein EPN23_02720 [Verrucomicrobiota bacterium]
MGIEMSYPPSAFSRQPKGRAGQATAELVVGLLALLVVFMGMLQIQSLARAHTQTLLAARQQAGQDALASPYVLRNATLRWISDWQAGTDKIIYSRDDTARLGNSGAANDGIIVPANPSALNTYVPGNELSAASTATLAELFLTHGQSISQPIDLFPIIRNLVYGATAIQFQSDAWLTWTHIE